MNRYDGDTYADPSPGDKGANEPGGRRRTRGVAVAAEQKRAAMRSTEREQHEPALRRSMGFLHDMYDACANIFKASPQRVHLHLLSPRTRRLHDLPLLLLPPAALSGSCSESTVNHNTFNFRSPLRDLRKTTV